MIKQIIKKANDPLQLIKGVINEFQEDEDYEDESFTISPDLFENTKPFTFVEMPFRELIEIKLRHSLNKFQNFPYDSFEIVLRWKTINIGSCL